MRFGYVHYFVERGGGGWVERVLMPEKKKRNRAEAPSRSFKLRLTDISADSGGSCFCGCLKKQNRTDLGESGHLLREATNGELNGWWTLVICEMGRSSRGSYTNRGCADNRDPRC